MNCTIIQVESKWTLGGQIGNGGYGRVYEAVNEANEKAAVKLIPKAPGTDRELLFINLDGVRNVIPILESGEWDDHWVLVMPRAEYSLRDYMNEQGPLPLAAFTTILADLAQSLSDLNKKGVVHRDIKPDNLLFWNEHWCLSDFGISRYAEASTAPDTQKWAWSKPYNAPERWRDERASHAADIYSTGIMAFEMLTSKLPFSGPDYRHQHLHEQSPSLEDFPVVVDSLIVECLHKAPDARPSAENILARIDRLQTPANPAVGLLQAANQNVVRRKAKDAAAHSQALSVREKQQVIVSSATRSLGMVFARFAQVIRENAPHALWLPPSSRDMMGASIRLERGELSVSKVSACSNDAWREWTPAFQVYAFASISLKVPLSPFRFEGRSHSLWYCDARTEGEFCWYETAFKNHPLMPRTEQLTPVRFDPFTLSPGERAGKALSNAMASYIVAWPFTPVEPGNEEDFINRWIKWFALGLQDKLLQSESNPPQGTQDSWRH